MAKTDKICIVCGKGFQGTAKAEVCGATCRKKLQRLKAAGKKPEYVLVGGKNTKAGKVKESPKESSDLPMKENVTDKSKAPSKPANMTYQQKRFRLKMGLKD